MTDENPVRIQFADGHSEIFSADEWRLVCLRAPIDCALRSCYGPDARSNDRSPTTTFPSHDFHLLRSWLLGGPWPKDYSEAILLWYEMDRWQIPVPPDFFWRWPQHWNGRLRIVSAAWCQGGQSIISAPSILFWNDRWTQKEDAKMETCDIGPLYRFSPETCTLTFATLTTTISCRNHSVIYERPHCTRDTLLFSMTREVFVPRSFIFWLPSESRHLRHHPIDGKAVLSKSAFDFPKFLIYRVKNEYYLTSGFELDRVSSIRLKNVDPIFAKAEYFGRLSDGTTWFFDLNTLVFCTCTENGQVVPGRDVQVISDNSPTFDRFDRFAVLPDRLFMVRESSTTFESDSVDNFLTVCELFRIDVHDADQIVVRPFLRVELKDHAPVNCFPQIIDGSDLLWIFGEQVNLARGTDTFNHLILCDVRQGTVLWELHGPDEIRQLLPANIHGFDPINGLMPIGGNLLVVHPNGFAVVGHSEERPLYGPDFIHATNATTE